MIEYRDKKPQAIHCPKWEQWVDTELGQAKLTVGCQWLEPEAGGVAVILNTYREGQHGSTQHYLTPDEARQLAALLCDRAEHVEQRQREGRGALTSA